MDNPILMCHIMVEDLTMTITSLKTTTMVTYHQFYDSKQENIMVKLNLAM